MFWVKHGMAAAFPSSFPVQPSVFFTRPISATLLVLAALWLIFLVAGLKKRPLEDA
jgi:hypothetical protein